MIDENLPRSALAEETLRLIIRVRHGEDDGELDASSQTVGIISTRSSQTSVLRKKWTRETALLRLMAIIETFVDGMAAERLRQLVNLDDPTFVRLIEDLEENLGRNWQNRKDAYKGYFGFSLESRNGWSFVDAGIEVRNCMAHGFGTLTVQQRKNSKIAAQISPIGATICDGRIHLNWQSIDRLSDGCMDFVRAVAKEIETSPPV